MAKTIRIKKYALNVPIYDVPVQLVFTNDVQGYVRSIGEWEKGLESGEAITWATGEEHEYAAISVLPFNVNLDYSVHECVHIGTIIGDRAGILPASADDASADEAYAYLVAYIHTRMMEFKKKANKKK